MEVAAARCSTTIRALCIEAFLRDRYQNGLLSAKLHLDESVKRGDRPSDVVMDFAKLGFQRVGALADRVLNARQSHLFGRVAFEQDAFCHDFDALLHCKAKFCVRSK